MPGIATKLALYRALWLSGAHAAYRRLRPPAGVVLMFHRVVEADDAPGFCPTRQFTVTAGVLDATIVQLRESGHDLVDLDEAHRRLSTGEPARRFACLTFDDGYRDSADGAFRICAAHSAPMSVYVTTGFVDGSASLWWYGLERLIARRSQVVLRDGRGEHRVSTASPAEKSAAFALIGAQLRSLPAARREAQVGRLSADHDFDIAGHAAALVMDWPALVELAARPGVEIGAHTVSHPSLAALSEAEARAEIKGSRRELESRLGRPVRHLAFPFGDATAAGAREFALSRELGFATAVTTRHGVIAALTAGDARSRLHALPRIPSDPGDTRRTVAVKVSGLPAALLDRRRR